MIQIRLVRLLLLLDLPVWLAVRVPVAHVLAVATTVRESLQTFLRVERVKIG